MSHVALLARQSPTFSSTSDLLRRRQGSRRLHTYSVCSHLNLSGSHEWAKSPTCVALLLIMSHVALLARQSPTFSSTGDLLRRQGSRREHTDSKLSFMSGTSRQSHLQPPAAPHRFQQPPHLALGGGQEIPDSATPGSRDFVRHASGIDPSHPLREWGKRAESIPLKVSGPKLFLKKNYRAK